MTNVPGETAHQTYPATPEEVAALNRQAESLALSRGTPWEYSPHIVSFKAPGIAHQLIPEGARAFLRLGREPVDCEVVTNARTMKTCIKFSQISAPVGYPGYFKNSVEYDLSDGHKTAEATFMNTQILMEVPNRDHPSGQTPHIEQADARQLAQIMHTI